MMQMGLPNANIWLPTYTCVTERCIAYIRIYGDTAVVNIHPLISSALMSPSCAIIISHEMAS